jgi:hypothetical protein
MAGDASHLMRCAAFHAMRRISCNAPHFTQYPACHEMRQYLCASQKSDGASLREMRLSRRIPSGNAPRLAHLRKCAHFIGFSPVSLEMRPWLAHLRRYAIRDNLSTGSGRNSLSQVIPAASNGNADGKGKGKGKGKGRGNADGKGKGNADGKGDGNRRMDEMCTERAHQHIPGIAGEPRGRGFVERA